MVEKFEEGVKYIRTSERGRAHYWNGEGCMDFALDKPVLFNKISANGREAKTIICDGKTSTLWLWLAEEFERYDGKPIKVVKYTHWS